MTASELLHHTFPWEERPGVPRVKRRRCSCVTEWDVSRPDELCQTCGGTGWETTT